MVHKLVVMFAAVMCGVGAAPVPASSIPVHSDGIHYGLYGSQVHLEIFVDMCCDDCQRDWPKMSQLMKHFPAGSVEFTMHHLPLPFHRGSFLGATAVQAVNIIAPELVWNFTSAVFAHQSYVSNGATANLTQAEVASRFADIAEHEGVERSAITPLLNPRSSAGKQARGGFKYSLQHGALAGTPAYVVNGVLITDPSVRSWSPRDWQGYLDTLISEAAGADSVVPATTDSSMTAPSSATTITPLPAEEREEGGGCNENAQIATACARVRKGQANLPEGSHEELPTAHPTTHNQDDSQWAMNVMNQAA